MDHSVCCCFHVVHAGNCNHFNGRFSGFRGLAKYCRRAGTYRSYATGEILVARRISVFGHIARLECDVPAHIALAGASIC